MGILRLNVMNRKLHILYILFATLLVTLMPLDKKKVYNVVEADAEQLLTEGEYLISPYDNIFQRVCRRHNVDWRLMSAIAYGESRFNPNAQSPRGAVGLMQVMPHIAQNWDVTAEELLDPAINIDVACRLYKSMQKMLRLPKETSNMDRIAFTIASYNCGASRIIDARNLAECYDDPKNEWESVSDYLVLLAQEEYYNHESVVAGRFREGNITVAYTNKVLGRYRKYLAM